MPGDRLMTSKMLAAMMEAQKKARMKPVPRLAIMSTENKIAYVPPPTVTIRKSNQEDSAAT